MADVNPELLLIGAVLADPKVAYHDAVEEGVTADSFLDPASRLLWEKLSSVMARTGSVDRYALLTELRSREDAQQIVDTIPHDIIGAKTHAIAVRENEKTARLKQLVGRYSRVTGKIDGHITDFASELMGLLSANKTHQIKSIGEVAPEVIDELRLIAEGKSEGMLGLDSFVSPVNSWGIPYPRGKVTVFAGYRNIGKSSHLKHEALFMGKKDIPCGVISMEDTDRDIVTNTVTVDGAGFMWRYQRGIGDMDKFSSHLNQISKLPVYLIDSPQTIDQLESSITLLVARYGCRMIFIDHLHEIHGGRYHSIDDRYTDYMERICATIKRLDVSCCLYAQFSRDCEKEGRPPRMSDLKGSSAIEQKARRIYMLYQDAELTEEANAPRFVIEGSKISNSGWGSKEDRKATLRYAKTHDGFEVME